MVLLSIPLNSVIGSHSLAHLVRRVFLTVSQLLIMRLSWSRLSLSQSTLKPSLRCPLFHMSLISSLSRYSLQARRGLFWTYVMSIISFGNRSLGVKIEEFYYHMLIRAITFLVSISSLGITISIFFRITKLFWVSPGFFLVSFGVFVLHHFRSV